MAFKIGDRVMWKDFPDYGVGIVLEEGYYSSFFSVRFEKYENYFGEDDCHLVFDGNLEYYKNPMDIVNDYHETKISKTPFDEQVGGGHYKTMTIQPVEFILANQLGFCEGNAIKYLCRYKQKGGVQDLKKAKHYVEMLISKYDLLEEKNV